jgi:hypothetical protein
LYGHEDHEIASLQSGQTHSVVDLSDCSTVHLCATDASGGNLNLHCVCRPVGQCECLQDAGPRALARWTLIPGWNADENVPWRRRKLKIVEVSLETIPHNVELLAKQLLAATSPEKIAPTGAVPGALFGMLFRVLNDRKDVVNPGLTKTGKRLFADASICDFSEHWQNERPRRNRAPTIFFGQYASPPSSPPRKPSKRRSGLIQDPDIHAANELTGNTQVQAPLLQKEAEDNVILRVLADMKSQEQVDGNIGKDSQFHSESEDQLIGRRICKEFSTGKYEGSTP